MELSCTQYLLHRIPAPDIFGEQLCRRKRLASEPNETHQLIDDTIPHVSNTESEYEYTEYGYDQGEYDYSSYSSDIEIPKNKCSGPKTYLDVAAFEQNQIDTYKNLPRNIYCELVDTLDTQCFEQSLLEIWMYNEEIIKEISTEDLLTAINRLDRSPYFGFRYNYSKLLGSIQRNESGYIIGAKAVLYNLATFVDYDNIQYRSFLERGAGPQLLHDKQNIIWQDGAIRTILDMANVSSKKGR